MKHRVALAGLLPVLRLEIMFWRRAAIVAAGIVLAVLLIVVAVAWILGRRGGR